MPEPEITLGLDAWSTWQPGEDHAVFTRNIAGDVSQQQLEAPVLSDIPPMQRRRLSKLARVVFHLLNQGLGRMPQEPVIFSSSMGEIQRTQNILSSIASEQAVSPAAFSLSVHNAIGGLWSLIYGVHQPMLSISPPGGSPIAALLEAYGMLQQGRADSVCVVCYEEPYPEFYQPYLRSPAAPCGVAMRLQHDAKATISLSKANDRSEQGGEEFTQIGPDFELLCNWLQGQHSVLRVAEAQCLWQLDVAQ